MNANTLLCCLWSTRMINQVFNYFERTEFSDDIYSIFGRALTTATRFDSSCKTLARLPLVKVSLMTKHALSNNEYDPVIENIINKYKNLNRAIDSLGFNGDIKDILTDAREARNELMHEGTLGVEMGFDFMEDEELSSHLESIEILVRKIIKGDALVSVLLSVQNKEPISDYPFSEGYENSYSNWVMQRYET